jgi:quinol-cytochrome oxidoreductase complex cytochrome b subunit
MQKSDLIMTVGTNPAMAKDRAKTRNTTIWFVKALLRSCFWHWIGIPLVALGLKIVHFRRARKHGIPFPKPEVLWSDSNCAVAKVMHT